LGLIPKFDELLALAGPAQGATPLEQMLDMAARGVRIGQLKHELDITADPGHLYSYPDLAVAFGPQTLELLNHYVMHGGRDPVMRRTR
jgi:hypothetical protein